MEATIPYDSSGNFSLANGYLAVSGQTILASQHNPPLEDLASGLSQALLRSGAAPMAGNLNLNGFKITNLLSGTDAGDIVLYSQLQAVVAQIATAVPTGSVQAFRRTTAPTGWIKENGLTIGNTASGATNRANADTEALFTLLWGQFSNTILPIQTSGGVASTRGASAAADFAANKRMPLFDSRSRFLRGADDGLAYDVTLTVGTAQDDAIKNHTHTIAPHEHSVPSRIRPEYALDNGGNRVGSVNGQNIVGTTADPMTTSSVSLTTNANAGSTLETRGRSSVVLYCIKL